MGELTKSSIYVVTALVLGFVAFQMSRPRGEEADSSDQVGELLAPEFEDPNQAASMRIVTYNETLAELDKFEVALSGGNWTIPSQSDYPADAEKQMEEAANHLIGVKIFDVAGTKKTQHAKFGVVDPDEVELGTKGVGIHVTIKNDQGDVLAAVIVGKEVKNEPNKRFVRIARQDPTYVCELDPKKFSTKFEDWIDRDLLELNALDVSKIRFRDYSLRVLEGGLQPDPRVDVSVSWDDTSAAPKWALDSMIDYVNGKPEDSYLQADEQLDADKLNGVKSSLDDLEISGVVRKPKGLGADLRVKGDFLNDPENRRNLQDRGFFPFPIGGGQFEMLSANGELHATMKDGVKYIMRWGGIVAESSGEARRVLFVTTEFDPSMLPEPKYEPLPTVTGATKPGDAKKGGEKKDGKKKDDTKKKSEPPKEDPAEARKRIEKANELKKQEWQDKVKAAQKKVDSLNQKFSSWFYLVSSDMYAKLYLSRYDMIKATSAPSGADSFRKLQKEGVEKRTPPTASPHGGPPGGLPRGLPPQF